MDNPSSAVEVLIHGANTLFILMGAVMVLAMHAGFAFLEVGTVRLKNQVNALSVRYLTDRCVRLPVLRRRDVERQFRCSGLAGSAVWCPVP